MGSCSVHSRSANRSSEPSQVLRTESRCERRRLPQERATLPCDEVRSCQIFREACLSRRCRVIRRSLGMCQSLPLVPASGVCQKTARSSLKRNGVSLSPSYLSSCAAVLAALSAIALPRDRVSVSSVCARVKSKEVVPQLSSETTCPGESLRCSILLRIMENSPR